MTRAGGWIAGGLLATGCFFQPTLDPAGDGSSGAGTDTGATGSTQTAEDTSAAPTTGAATGSASGSTGATADATTGATTGVASQCGDFEVDPGEECDNGAANNGGGAVCKADCTLNQCGDGYLASALEACDDGNLDDGDGCSASCTLESCGDGITDGTEECDDGNAVDDDACSNACRLPVCGDGIVNGGEACDAGGANSDSGACLTSCKTAVCGDGFLEEGVEQCDDGNGVDDDGCSNACTVAVCGNGVIDPGEQCDDANKVDQDACLNSCKQATCGDGVVYQDKEECDTMGLSMVCVGCVRAGYWVFVTSVKLTAEEVGGADEADALCTQLAQGTGVEGTYKAWLSDGPMNEAADRLVHSPVPYLRVDGTHVAGNWAQFASPNHQKAINLTETGMQLPNEPDSCLGGKNAAVWTGTVPDGQAAESCLAWTSSQIQQNGQAGMYHRSDSLWSGCNYPCNTKARLYCVEQP